MMRAINAAMIAMFDVRKRSHAFGRGRIEFLRPSNIKVLVFLREHEGETLLVACNLSRTAQAVQLDLSRFAGKMPMEMWSEQPFPCIGDLPYLLTFGPYGYYWFLLTDAEAAETRT